MMNYWWLKHDWVKYKVPVSEGRVLIPQEYYLEPNFKMDPTELWYNYVHDHKDRRRIADFSGWGSATFFVNQRAYEIFQDMFTEHGRVYPVRCSNEPHYIVLIDTVLDAIDLSRSRFDRLGLHAKLEDDISKMNKVVLKSGYESNVDIFRLGPGFKLGLELIVSDRFRLRYTSSNLTGLFFLHTDGSRSEVQSL